MNLPHRHPFRFAGRGSAGEARVVLTGGDSWRRGEPVTSPAFWVELLAQSAAIQLGDEPQGPVRVALAGVESFELLREPGAGAVVVVHAELSARLGQVSKVRTEARVEGELVARADLLLALEVGD